MNRVGRLALVVAAVAAGACGIVRPVSSLLPDPGLLAGGLVYECDGLAFDPELIVRPGTDEQAATEQAEILRAYIEQTAREGEPLPVTGWHVVDETSDSADYLVTRNESPEDVGVYHVSIHLGVSYANQAQWNRCRVELQRVPGLNTVRWRLDPDGRRPNQGSGLLDLLVTEEECASGRSVEGSLIGPAIRQQQDRILILFAAKPPSGFAQTCQSNPSFAVTIDIGAPIGHRLLVDPGRWPQMVVDITKIGATPS